MRVALTFVLAVLVSVSAAAQLPRPGDLAGMVRKMPSLDGFMKNRPLESTFDDTIGPQLFLDKRTGTRQPGDMKRLPRTSNGGFMLQPGLWEGEFESYCLRAATWAPHAGDGYLWAPIKGGRAHAISTILRVSSAHPNVPQGDIQLLLWALLSRTRVNDMPPKLQAAARALLPATEINAMNVSGLQAMDIAERTRVFRGVTGPVRRALDVESELRWEFSRANANYEQIEKIAVLAGAPPAENRNAIKRGQWSRHPAGYYVRYYPDSYARMKLQILVPPRVRITRDHLHRITSIEDSRGRIDTTYNDAIAPRTHPRLPQLKAYRFKTIRITRTGADGRPEVHEFKDKGWTFHQSRPQRRGIADILAAGTRWLQSFLETPVEARQIDWERWIERGQEAYEHWQDAEWLRDRAEAATTTGDESAIDDIGDTEHYADGVEVAITGDTGERVAWIAETHERFGEALEHAISVLDRLPTTSTPDDDPAPRDWDFGGGVGMPSGGGQTLGVSGRFR